MRYKRWLSILLSSLFLLSTTIPLFLADFRGGKISETENRYLTKFPTLFSGGKFQIEGFRTGLENWINDNAAGRNASLDIVRKVNYGLDKEHPGDIIEGKDGWLFWLPSYDFPNFQNTYVPDDVFLGRYGTKFKDIQDSLSDMGIEYLLCMWPRKYAVYPEFMPKSIHKIAEKSFSDIFSDNLAKKDGLHFLNPYNALIDAKPERLIYSKAKDASHWNNYGAFIAYQEMMRKIKELLPQVRILTENDFIIDDQEFVTRYPYGFETSEMDYVYKIKSNHVVQNKNYFQERNIFLNDQWKSFNYYLNDDQSLPKAVVVGDSYMWMFMLEQMAQSFSELAFIHVSDCSQLGKVISFIHPDIVVQASINIQPLGDFLTPEQILANTPLISGATEGFEWLDFCNWRPVEKGIITLEESDATLQFDGWARDVLSGGVASKVIIQAGDFYYEAAYGLERAAAAKYFNSESYRYIGYRSVIPAQEVKLSNTIYIHVIGADGTYRYPPVAYIIN